MSSLYNLRSEARAVLMIFLYLAIGLQGVNLLLLNMTAPTKKRILKNLLSLLRLLYLVAAIYILSHLFTNVLYGHYADILPFVRIPKERGKAVVTGYVLLNMLIITRVIADAFRYWQEISDSITRLSIKDAMDRIPVGNIFCSEDDRLIFVNPAMTRVMVGIGCEEYESGERFWKKIKEMDISKEGGSIPTLSGEEESSRDVSILRTGGRSWEFLRRRVRIGDKWYTSISAIDVSEKDKLNLVLKNQYEELREIEKELRQMSETIGQSQQEEAVIELKNRIHDIMGQRLSIIHQVLESNRYLRLSSKELQDLLSTMLRDLKDKEAEDPRRIFENIRSSCALIQVSLSLQGEFLGKKEQQSLMIQVIREAVTNAVRHGKARNIEVRISENSGEIITEIINDGTPPEMPLEEKEGLRGMKRRAAEQEGRIHITTEPLFSVVLFLPKK